MAPQDIAPQNTARLRERDPEAHSLITSPDRTDREQSPKSSSF